MSASVYDSMGRLKIIRGIPGAIETLPLDGPNIDAFGRERISSIFTIFDAKFHYSVNSLSWESIVTAGGTATHVPAYAAVKMNITTASGDKIVRQSHRYFRYQPAKSWLIILTGIMGALKTNVRQRIGYFDTGNGVFFEQDGVNLKVVQRSSTSGSPVDTAITQANWNLDGLNSAINPLNPSGITLDMSKAQIFIIDLQWLGVGRVRFGFSIGGLIYYVHEIKNANTLTVPYMTTATLPIRFELEATGTVGSGTDMYQICAAVMSEGGSIDDLGNVFSANNGITSISVTTRRPILSIRPAATFNSLTNRVVITPETLELLAGSGTLFYELVYNGALTGDAFATVDSKSAVEADVAATSIAGGTIVDSGYAAASGAGAVRGVVGRSILSKVGFTLSAAGVQDRLSLVCTAITGTVTGNGSFRWHELS